MEKNSDWLNEKYMQIEALTKDFSISKYNLLKISFLKRLLEESEIHSTSCLDCKQNLPELEKLIGQIPMLDQIEYRAPYERKFNATRKHFHEKHKFIPPYYFSTRWSIFGVLTGGVIASIVSFYFNSKIQLDPLLAGLALGLIVGYIVGSTKEVSFRKSEKII
ncbi:MAG: hypothetical protein PF541_11470 [Prolixibacteraceae bacterium]|jgi:hypothetical protein|nr:hypothetical protein [Prolixibacteraceae bacterium]